jgi:hypothetical protein
MKKILLVLAVAGYMSACAPTSQTTSSTGTTTDGTTTDCSTSDSNTSDSSATGTDTNTNDSGATDNSTDTTSNTTNDSGMNNSSTTDSDMESADSTSTQSSTDMAASGNTSESDIMGSSTTITMDQLPKTVRDAYMKMPGHENATGVKVYQVKTSEHPVLYKIEGTSGSTDYVHYFTPEGNEVQMNDQKK